MYYPYNITQPPLPLYNPPPEMPPNGFFRGYNMPSLPQIPP